MNQRMIKSLQHWIFVVGVFFLQNSCQTKPPKDDLPLQQQWFMAVKDGNLNKLKKLHQSENLPWDLTAANGVTALMLASRYGHLEMIKYLIDQKVNVNDFDFLGYNSISYCLFGPLETAQKLATANLLIKNQADVFKEDHIKARPVFYLIENGHLVQLKLISWSVNSPCDQAKKLEPDFSLIKYAEENDQPEVAKFFKELGCH